MNSGGAAPRSARRSPMPPPPGHCAAAAAGGGGRGGGGGGASDGRARECGPRSVRAWWLQFARKCTSGHPAARLRPGKCTKVSSYVKSRLLVACERALVLLPPWDERATDPALLMAVSTRSGVFLVAQEGQSPQRANTTNWHRAVGVSLGTEAKRVCYNPPTPRLETAAQYTPSFF